MAGKVTEKNNASNIAMGVTLFFGALTGSIFFVLTTFYSNQSIEHDYFIGISSGIFGGLTVFIFEKLFEALTTYFSIRKKGKQYGKRNG